MNKYVFRLLEESTLASILVAALAFAGLANGTVAIVTIGFIQIVDLPALIEVLCKEARTGCQTDYGQ